MDMLFSGLMFGGFIGVVVMCVLQINRTNRLEKNDEFGMRMNMSKGGIIFRL